MSEAKLKKLARGNTVRFKHDELGGIYRLKLGTAKMKKIQKAHKSGKGVRIALEPHEIEGSGLGSFVKKGAKMVCEKKQLSKLKDQGLDKGLDYALNQAGMDPSISKAVKKVAEGAVNSQLNQMAGSGMTLAEAYAQHKTGQGIGFKKVMRTGAKALKVGNKISNALGYDDLQDMAIEGLVGETLGIVDLTLGNIATHALQKEVGRQISKRGGSFRKMGGSFRKMGGSIAVERYEHDDRNRIRDDRSNFIRYDHPAYSAWQDNARYFA
jgi:hypothetical protein